MTTTIDTTPAQNFQYNDTATGDTITVMDGPPENGVQTTDIATVANGAYILANKTTVTFDGGSKGDNLFLDNPDPAAGLQQLTIQNLGGSGTINGANPNANGADIAVGTLVLVAPGSIGVSRALRTQVSTLEAVAGTGGAGNVTIDNGVSAPTTLNIVALSATNPAGGSVTLTNNGTINDFIDGIAATGSISIEANGTTADFNTGSGAGITSLAGSIDTEGVLGEDTNLGDGVGGGSMSAAAGITWSTGRDFTVNANAIVTNSTSGNISITAGGNITLLTSPGNVANAPEIVDNASGGSIFLQAGPGRTLTLNSTGTTAVKSTNGITNSNTITLDADAMVIGAAINSGTARTTLATVSGGQAIDLGASNAPGVLGLTQAELNQVTAGVVQVGDPSDGSITILAPISNNPANSSVFTLDSGGSISETAFGSLSIPNLRVSTSGSVTLNNSTNIIAVLAANVTGSLTVNDDAHVLTVGTVDGVVGIGSFNNAITLTADAMTFSQQVNAGTGVVTLSPFTTTQQISLGAGNVSGTLGLTDTELGEITASMLKIKDINGSGNITVANPVTRHAGYNILALTTGGSVIQNAGLSVANLAVFTGNGISFAPNVSDTVDTLAFGNTAGTVLFVNGSGNALTIGGIGGLPTSFNAGTATEISTGLNLTLATGLSTTGVTALMSTGGKILDGDNGADVDVSAQLLTLSAATGIGAAGTPLQTQTGFLGALTGTGGIFINNGAAVPATLNIANGSVVVASAGNIVLTNNGTIDVLNNTDVIEAPGNITLKALGANADINTGGQAVLAAVEGAGLVDVEAGRDITLGNVDGSGEVFASSGSLVVKAGRNIGTNTGSGIGVGSGSGSLTVMAGGNLTMNASNGGAIFTTGGSISLTAGLGATMTLSSSGTDAVASSGGDIALTADNLFIDKGVNGGADNILIQPATAGQLISVGTPTAGLQLTNAALGLVTAKNVFIGNASAGSVFLGGAVAPAHVTNLTISTGGNVSAASGSTIGVAGALTINFGENGLGDTADLTNLSLGSHAAAINVIGGTGNDTILASPALDITFTGGGGTDTFEGTLASLSNDTITDLHSPDKIVVSDGNFANFSFQLTGETLSFFGSPELTLSNSPTGLLVATRDPVAGVDLTDVTPMQTSTPAGTTANLFVQNATNGNLGIADLGNNSILAAFSLGQVGSDFKFAGTGGFNGSDTSDLLLRGSAMGNFELFDISNSQITGATALGNVGLEYQVSGFGDFSSNPGETDMLMRSTQTGNFEVYDIANNAITGAAFLGNVGLDMQVVGFGDFSGNPGETDMMMRSTQTGNFEVYDIQHNQVVGASSLGDVGLEWQVLGFGDFSSNPGESDMLLRNVNNGAIELYDIQNNHIVGASAFGNIGTAFQPVGFANLTGNANETDMVMQNTSNGTLHFFDIQHNQLTGEGALGLFDSGFQILGVGLNPHGN